MSVVLPLPRKPVTIETGIISVTFCCVARTNIVSAFPTWQNSNVAVLDGLQHIPTFSADPDGGQADLRSGWMATGRPVFALAAAATPVSTDSAPAMAPARWPSGSGVPGTKSIR